MGGSHTLAARGVISSFISLPSSSNCGLKIVCVARTVGDVLNPRWEGNCCFRGIRAVLDRCACCVATIALFHCCVCLIVGVVTVVYLRAAEQPPASRRGTKRSRMGGDIDAGIWRRMLSCMKSVAGAGALAQHLREDIVLNSGIKRWSSKALGEVLGGCCCCCKLPVRVEVDWSGAGDA